MFRKQKRRFADDQAEFPETIIASNTHIKGTITGPDVVLIAGMFEGDVQSEGLLVITEKGKVKASITCHDLILEGTVEGNVEKAGNVEIRAGGRLTGDIRCDRIAMAQGSFVEGAIHMTQPDTQPSQFVEKRKDYK